MVGQVIDDEINELNLIGSCDRFPQEITKGLLRGFAIEANQRSDKSAKSLAGLLGLFEVMIVADARCQQYSFKFTEVGGGEGLIEAEFVDGDVVFVGQEKLSCLGAEAIEFIAAPKGLDVDRDFAAEFVDEVGVDRLAARFFDEANQVAEAFAGIFEHRNGDIGPPGIGLHLLNQAHLFAHHGDAVFLFQGAEDFLERLAESSEVGIRPRFRLYLGQLQSQH